MGLFFCCPAPYLPNSPLIIHMEICLKSDRMNNLRLSMHTTVFATLKYALDAFTFAYGDAKGRLYI